MAIQKKERHVFPDGSRLIRCEGRERTWFYFTGDESWCTDKFHAKVLPTAFAPAMEECKRYYSDRDLYAIAILPVEQQLAREASPTNARVRANRGRAYLPNAVAGV